MTWSYQFSDGAKRQFRKLDRPIQSAMLGALDRLAFEMSNPSAPRTVKVKKLGGRGEEWRLRVGDYRVIFEHRGDHLVILVLKVGHRGDVYRD
ncbi:MAG TPA: type II toxin-antitoxin system RelE/ParE family toxin [Pantanalinema sp.]